MSINIQVAVDKTTSDLRAAVELIRKLPEDTCRNLLEAKTLAVSEISAIDPDFDTDTVDSVLVVNIIKCIASGEIVL